MPAKASSESPAGSLEALLVSSTSRLQADSFPIASEQVRRIAIHRDTSARFEVVPRKTSRQHSDSGETCAPRPHRVIRRVAGHDCMLRRYASCAQERDLDEGGIGLVVLYVVSAG